MSKSFRSNGKNVKIHGQSADVASGRIFRKGNAFNTVASPTAGGGNFIGVVIDDIIGTSSTLTTVDGRPILVGDGNDGTQVGDGMGDMGVVGVYTFEVVAGSAVISGAMPAYMNVADGANPHSTLVASGVTAGRIGTTFVPISGALVGFSVENEYTGDTAPFTGKRVVDVKLLELPLHNLASVAP